MTQSLLAVITPAGFGVAFLVTWVSAIQLYRQKITGFRSIREFLLAVYVIINFLMLLDLLRIELGTPEFMQFYPVLGLSLSFVQGILLASASLAMNLNPNRASYRTFLRDLSKSKIHSFFFYLFVAAVVAVELYYVVFKPYGVVLAQSITGERVYSLSIIPTSVVAVLALFAFFLLYPVLLFVRGVRRIPNPHIRRSLSFLPPGWILVAAVYLSFQLYAWLYGIDASSILYLINSTIFALVTREFRNGTMLAGFVEMTAKDQPAAGAPPNRETVTSISGRKALVEVDPSFPFEDTLRELCNDCIASQLTVFIFTPVASRLYNAVNRLPEAKLFAMSSDASYLKPTQRPNEVQMPRYDVAVLLDTLDQTVATTAGKQIVVIFDSVSDMILTTSFDKCYKFLKQANEINAEPRVTALFIVLKGVHKPETLNVLKSLFQSHFVIDSSQLRIGK